MPRGKSISSVSIKEARHAERKLRQFMRDNGFTEGQGLLDKVMIRERDEGQAYGNKKTTAELLEKGKQIRDEIDAAIKPMLNPGEGIVFYVQSEK